VGDLTSNLENLAREAVEPAEPTASHYWKLLTKGFPAKRLTPTLEKARGAPFSSRGTEQAHVSASNAAKFHPEMGKESLVVKAICHMSAPLTMAPDDAAAHNRREAAITKLEGAAKKVLSGRQYFCSLAMEMVYKQTGLSKAHKVEMRKTIVRTHGGEWRQLPPEKKLEYERQARQVSDARAQSIQEELDVLVEAAALRELRMEGEKASKNPWTSSGVRWNQDDLDHLQMFYNSSELSKSKVKERRKEANIAPAIPDTHLQLTYNAYTTIADTPPPCQRWVAEVCAQRLHFHRKGLRIAGARPDDVSFYMFGFGLQNPVVLGLTTLELVPRMPPGEFEDVSLAFADSWAYDFHIKALACRYSCEDMQTIPSSSVQVLDSLVFLGNGRVVSDGPVEPLERFLHSLPPLKVNEPQAQGAPGDRAKAFLDNPWIAAHIGPGAALPGKRKKVPGVDSDASESEHELDEQQLQDEVTDFANDIYENLKTLRFNEKAVAVDDRFFRVVPLGGEGTRKKVGMEQDAWRGQPVGDVPKLWCDRFRLQQAMRFDINCYDTGSKEEKARQMAREFCRVMTHYFLIYDHAGRTDEFRYSADQLARPPPEPEWERMVMPFTTGPAKKGVDKLRDIVPVNPA